jgi:hypothetical protein
MKSGEKEEVVAGEGPGPWSAARGIAGAGRDQRAAKGNGRRRWDGMGEDARVGFELS